jgi:hypothetical protein
MHVGNQMRGVATGGVQVECTTLTHLCLGSGGCVGRSVYMKISGLRLFAFHG